MAVFSLSGVAYYVYAGHGYYGHGYIFSHLSEEITEWVTEHLALTEDKWNKFEDYRKEIFDEVVDIHNAREE